MIEKLPAIPGYTVTGLLGAGGMGAVYSAEQLSTGKEVAIKCVLAGKNSKKFVSRFMREIELSRKLEHPNVIKILDCGKVDGKVPYIVMEKLEGQPLNDVISNEPLYAEEALSIFRQLTDALTYVHKQGLLHRDIKASNIFYTKHKRAVLLDFGLAYRADGALTKLTKTGNLVGTIATMAPEVLQGRQATVLSDIYSLGVTMYQTLVGQAPYSARTIIAVAAQMQEPIDLIDEVPRGTIGSGMFSVIKKCVALNESERYGTVAEVANALKQLNLNDVSGRASTINTATTQKVRAVTRDTTQGAVKVGGRQEQATTGSSTFGFYAVRATVLLAPLVFLLVAFGLDSSIEPVVRTGAISRREPKVSPKATKTVTKTSVDTPPTDILLGEAEFARLKRLVLKRRNNTIAQFGWAKKKRKSPFYSRDQIDKDDDEAVNLFRSLSGKLTKPRDFARLYELYLNFWSLNFFFAHGAEDKREQLEEMVKVARRDHRDQRLVLSEAILYLAITERTKNDYFVKARDGLTRLFSLAKSDKKEEAEHSYALAKLHFFEGLDFEGVARSNLFAKGQEYAQRAMRHSKNIEVVKGAKLLFGLMAEASGNPAVLETIAAKDLRAEDRWIYEYVKATFKLHLTSFTNDTFRTTINELVQSTRAGYLRRYLYVVRTELKFWGEQTAVSKQFSKMTEREKRDLYSGRAQLPRDPNSCFALCRDLLASYEAHPSLSSKAPFVKLVNSAFSTNRLPAAFSTLKLVKRRHHQWWLGNGPIHEDLVIIGLGFASQSWRLTHYQKEKKRIFEFYSRSMDRKALDYVGSYLQFYLHMHSTKLGRSSLSSYLKALSDDSIREHFVTYCAWYLTDKRNKKHQQAITAMVNRLITRAKLKSAKAKLYLALAFICCIDMYNANILRKPGANSKLLRSSISKVRELTKSENELFFCSFLDALVNNSHKSLKGILRTTNVNRFPVKYRWFYYTMSMSYERAAGNPIVAAMAEARARELAPDECETFIFQSRTSSVFTEK